MTLWTAQTLYKSRYAVSVRLMSELGQSRRFRRASGMSGFPLIATVEQTCRQVRNVPDSDNRVGAHQYEMDATKLWFDGCEMLLD